MINLPLSLLIIRGRHLAFPRRLLVDLLFRVPQWKNSRWSAGLPMACWSTRHAASAPSSPAKCTPGPAHLGDDGRKLLRVAQVHLGRAWMVAVGQRPVMHQLLPDAFVLGGEAGAEPGTVPY